MTDQSDKPTSEQLMKLSEEVNRIAGALARISTKRSAATELHSAATNAGTELSPDVVSSAIRVRRLRGRYFQEDLFADPAWDMMLELLAAELAGRRVAISSLCAAAAVPPTTALRWLNLLVKQGLFVRRTDPLDGRRVFVELAPRTSTSLQDYFRDLT